jgi:hypothetical protein
MASPLAHHLPTFAHERPANPPRRLTPLGTRGKPEGSAAKSVVAEAEERGRAQAIEAARGEMEAAREADRKEFAERLAAERAAWRTDVAERLASRLEDALSQIENGLADAVTRALTPFLNEAIRSRAVAEFAQTLARLKDGRDVAVRITGPEELLAALHGPFAAQADIAEYMLGDSADLAAVIGDTAIETKIAAWRERLTAALDGAANG